VCEKHSRIDENVKKLGKIRKLISVIFQQYAAIDEVAKQ
jgi:hypothetical protein